MSDTWKCWCGNEVVANHLNCRKCGKTRDWNDTYAAGIQAERARTLEIIDGMEIYPRTQGLIKVEQLKALIQEDKT